jgi:hypothetical protein
MGDSASVAAARSGSANMETVEKRIFAIVMIVRGEELGLYEIVCLEVKLKQLEEVESFRQVLRLGCSSVGSC